MASGDAVNALVATAYNATLDIKPGTGVEWIVHNIIIPDGLTTGVSLYYVTGAVTSLVGTFKKSLIGFNFHATATYYYQLKVLEATTQNIGYDGIVVK